MATLADITTHLSGLEDSSKKMISMLTAESASLADLKAQLLAAQASSDPVAIQAIIDRVDADKAAIDAGLAAVADPAAPPAA